MTVCGRITAGCLGMLLVLACGCDERSTPSPGGPSPSARRVPPIPPRPTTAELVDAPRKAMALGVYPLVMDVPQGLWQLKISTETGAATSISIEGPAPAGDVLIQVTHYPVLQPADALAKKEADGLKDMNAHRDTVLMSEMRAMGPAKVLERRTIVKDGIKELGKDGVTQIPKDEIKWNLMVFTPHPSKREQGPVFEWYMVSFTLLSREQYEKDKEFLEKIVGSLRYDPLAGDLGL